MTCGNVAVCVNEPASVRIVVSGLQVVKFKIGVVIITPVSVGIICCRSASSAVKVGRSEFAPSVVIVRYELYTAFVINSNDITEYILLVPIGIKGPFCISAIPVFKSYRRTVSIIYVNNGFGIRLFCNKKRAIVVIVSRYTVYGFACSETVAACKEVIGVAALATAKHDG